MKVRILYHDHCFDGAASAALVSRFFLDSVYPGADLAYTGMAHTPNYPFHDALFDSDHHAIVDYKYSSHPRVDWWFDHHQSAFLNPADEAHFRQDQNGRKFLDTSYKSCARLIQSIAGARFHYRCPDLDELVRWSEIIDGALYPDADTAVNLAAPAMQLTLVIDNVPSETVQQIIRLLAAEPLQAIMERPEIRRLYQPLYERHLQSIDLLRRHAGLRDGIIFFDLSGQGVDRYNKFVPYQLFPKAPYSVSITNPPGIVKISVGSNPWAPHDCTRNIATLCERYGGGGHPSVGAISLPEGETQRAREIAAQIIRDLRC
ncbi:MAG: phosphoesterase [Bryobacteraceae bacterium]